MRIIYNNHLPAPGEEEYALHRNMSQILLNLRNDSGFIFFDDDFYNYVKGEHGIDAMFSEKYTMVRHLEYIDLPDEVFTMLLLKYGYD